LVYILVLCALFLVVGTFITVYTKKQDESLEELGHNEVILNSLDSPWLKKNHILFGILQPLFFKVHDVHSNIYNVPAKMLCLDEKQFLKEA
jgi:hypothetical protein